MEPIQIIYLTSSTSSLIMGMPQVRQLVIKKSSDELNVGTWTMWLISQIIFLTYASTLHDRVLFTMQWIWLAFYIAMFSLILYYRKFPGGAITSRLKTLSFLSREPSQLLQEKE